MKLINKRDFFRRSSVMVLGLIASPLVAGDSDWMTNQLEYFKGEDVLAHIMRKAAAEKWKKLPIGEVIAKVAMELAGTPWRPFTLDVSPDAEFCVVNLKGMDCFTFIEYSLCLGRLIKEGKTSPEDLVNEVQFTLYRRGKMGDFTTRLHYVSDWYFDNEKKGVLKVLTPDLPGSQPFTKKVDFMSVHPNYYKQFQQHPELIAGIKAAEDDINARPMEYLPLDKLKEAEHLLKTGDIVCATTRKEGLDIGHCGLCLKDEKGGTHFMDASSIRRKMRVSYEPDMVATLKSSPVFTGVMVARPLELANA